MSKELTPLQALQNLTEYLTGGYRDCFEELSIIKTALKKLDKIETTTHSVLREDILKELKALEIIKEKEVNIPDLLDCIRNEKGDYIEDALKQYNMFQSTRWQLTQKEYDLLKEVML